MYHDSVTGLPTMESFLDFAEKMWKSSKPNRFAILSVNTGSFHKINQYYGYMQGDAFLSLFAQKLVRNNEYLLSACREKADLFLLLLDLDEITLSHANKYIHDTFSKFCEYVSYLYPDITLSFQIGICLLSSGEHSMADAISHAACARKTLDNSFLGKSNIAIAFYQDALLSKNNCENRVLPLFEEIMTNKHFILYLQPIFDLDNNQVIRAEALVRIMDNSGKLLKPHTFLPILEKYNLAYELDLLVMESILKLITHWIAIGSKPLSVSINLSEGDFSTKEFLKIFQELIEKYPDSQKYLEFEISESSFIHNPDYMLQVIYTIHEHGCRISLDGFGRDVLSLKAIGIPPVDTVKFDKSVLTASMRNPQNIHILKKLAEMFEDCQIPVLCEGIENDMEEDIIRQCGIHLVQGYYYGHPVPLDLFEKKYMVYELSHY